MGVPVRTRRSTSPLMKFFYNCRVTLNILVELLWNNLTFWTNRGCLLVGSLTDWVKIRARTGNAQFVPPCSKWRVESTDLKSGRFLGQGCSGIFYETTWSGLRSTNLLVRKDFLGVTSTIFGNEAGDLFELCHQNVVKNYCWTVDKRSCTLVMEYVKDDLYTVVQKRKEELWRVAALDRSLLSKDLVNGINFPFKLADAILIMLKIATGIEYLHDRGIFHGDLKPNNVLVNLEANPIVVKVADFGLIKSKRMTTLISEHAFCFHMMEWSAPEVFEDYFGSINEDLEYIWTPSLTNSNLSTATTEASVSYSQMLSPSMEKADSYSFALTCAYILGGKMWNANLSPKELRKRISSKTNAERPKLPSECPEMLTSLISLCWDYDPKKRLTFSEICTMLREILIEVSSGVSKIVQTHDEVFIARNIRGPIGQAEDTASLRPKQSFLLEAAVVEEMEWSASMNAIVAIDDKSMNIPPPSDLEEDALLHQKAMTEINIVHEIEEAASDGHSDIEVKVEEHSEMVSFDFIMEALSIGNCMDRRIVDIFTMPKLQSTFGDEDGYLLQDIEVPSLQKLHSQEPHELLEMEQKDLEALSIILGRHCSRFTLRYYWLVLRNLRVILPNKDSHKVQYGQYYARILERLVKMIHMVQAEGDDKYIWSHVLAYKDFAYHDLYHDGHQSLLKALRELTPDFPKHVDDDKFLDSLQQNMAATVIVFQSEEENLLVVNELCASRLISLANSLKSV